MPEDTHANTQQEDEMYKNIQEGKITAHYIYVISAMNATNMDFNLMLG